MATFISHSPEQTMAFGEKWGRAAVANTVIGLTGDLGAGKTHFVIGLAGGLEISTRVQSPTFALVHEYAGGRLPLAHIDLYRLESPQQIMAAGLDEYFETFGGVVVVEWCERWPGFRTLVPAAPGLDPAAKKNRPGGLSLRAPRVFQRIEIAQVDPETRRFIYDDPGP